MPRCYDTKPIISCRASRSPICCSKLISGQTSAACFPISRPAKSTKDRALLLTAILADAFNLGLEKMAESCPGTSLARLSWLGGVAYPR